MALLKKPIAFNLLFLHFHLKHNENKKEFIFLYFCTRINKIFT